MSYAIASGHRLTTDAAEQVLRDGGSAVDAVIAAACTAFVTEPVLAQPLGGGFLMLAPAQGAPKLLDGFVETPQRRGAEADLDLRTITVDFGTATQDFHIGNGTTAVPTLIPALFQAHEAAGRIPMRELVAHACGLARQGVEVSPFQAFVSRVVGPILTDTPELCALHAPDGKTPEAGTVVTNPALADVLEVMAAEGARFFTHGEIAAALAGMPGSQISREEIARVRPVWRTPLTLSRRDQDIALNPPPSLGGVQIALALSALPDCADAATTARAMLRINRLRRELKLDEHPEGAPGLLAPELVAELSRALKHMPATRGTTHISVIANDGTGAALTLSNGEGNGRLLPGTGITPNNMLGEEDLVPGGPTAWTPGRRLASMMCPMAIRDRQGGLTMLGSGGSNRIRSALTVTALELIDRARPLEEAITAPRLHVEGEKLDFEDLGDEPRREALLAAFPEATAWSEPNLFFGGVHAARRGPRGDASAAGDPRRAGAAATG